jgi:hypothetical protein
MRSGHPPGMASDSPFEVRVEVYADGEFSPAIVEKIGALLARRWPVEWDVNVPTRVNFEHPAEWRGVILLPDGTTPEMAHRQVAADLLALDPGHPLHFRTRWDFPQAPDQREVYEEHWNPKGR